MTAHESRSFPFAPVLILALATMACDDAEDTAGPRAGGAESPVFAGCPGIDNFPECDNAALWWVVGNCWTRGCPGEPCYPELPADLELDTASEWFDYEWHLVDSTGWVMEDFTVAEVATCSGGWWSPDDGVREPPQPSMPVVFRGARAEALVYVERIRCNYIGAFVAQYLHDELFTAVLDVSDGPLEPGSVSLNFAGISGVTYKWEIRDNGAGAFDHPDLVLGTIDYDTGEVVIDWGAEPRPPRGDVCVAGPPP